MITLTAVGPDGTRPKVTATDDVTVRDLATARYGLFWRTLKRNGSFTQRVKDGDVVTVEEIPIED